MYVGVALIWLVPDRGVERHLTELRTEPEYGTGDASNPPDRIGALLARRIALRSARPHHGKHERADRGSKERRRTGEHKLSDHFWPGPNH